MCILFLHVNTSPESNEYRLVVATNRDEYYKRPAKSAYHCPQTDVISGRDMEPGREGGTWLGFGSKPVQENGKPPKHCFACLTNISGTKIDHAMGRGELVINYLESELDFPQYIEDLDKQSKVFNGYNLIGVELSKDGSAKTFHNSNFPRIDSVYTGTHTLAFGNTSISSPLIKVLKGKDKFEDILDKKLDQSTLQEELLQLLKDETKYFPDRQLIKRDPTIAEHLSQIYVKFPEAGYGTRTHTIILIDRDWNLEFLEHTMEEPINVENPKWKVTSIKSRL
ncbi:transport and Golgi organization protein 2 homolog [Cylas formicarius]|uniref:transport and Golgi organization protein 2 homolog n=1 Tax=Cylas formicarius TaxID=197179 RepID=UPI002958715D|nr:transport and Golgi organization protein 2 homolog [Cylas formicarius]